MARPFGKATRRAVKRLKKLSKEQDERISRVKFLIDAEHFDKAEALIDQVTRENEAWKAELASFSIFNETACDPTAWHSVAMDLQAAAEYLDSHAVAHPGEPADEQRGLYRGALMLTAFSIENSLKALLVARGDVSGMLGELESPWSDGHDLLGLAKLLGWTPAKTDAQLLEVLGHLSRWATRYPVPLSATASKSFERALDEVEEEASFAELGRRILAAAGSVLERRSDPLALMLGAAVLTPAAALEAVSGSLPRSAGGASSTDSGSS